MGLSLSETLDESLSESLSVSVLPLRQKPGRAMIERASRSETKTEKDMSREDEPDGGDLDTLLEEDVREGCERTNRTKKREKKQGNTGGREGSKTKTDKKKQSENRVALGPKKSSRKRGKLGLTNVKPSSPTPQ